MPTYYESDIENFMSCSYKLTVTFDDYEMTVDYEEIGGN